MASAVGVAVTEKMATGRAGVRRLVSDPGMGPVSGKVPSCPFLMVEIDRREQLTREHGGCRSGDTGASSPRSRPRAAS